VQVAGIVQHQILANDAYAGAANAPVALNLLANDLDVDDDPFRLTTVRVGVTEYAIALAGDTSFTVAAWGVHVERAGPGDLHERGAGAFAFEYATADVDGASAWGLVTVATTTPNVAPVITSGGGRATAAVRVDEGAGVVTTVTATDADGSRPSFSIVLPEAGGGLDGAAFIIDAVTGQLRFAATPDYEAPGDSDGDNLYEVTVRASDGLAYDEQTLIVAVDDVAEARGTSKADVLTGGSRGDVIWAGSGDDIVTDLFGDNKLYGGDGNDRLTTGDGDDVLSGGAGADILRSAGGSDLYLVDNIGDDVLDTGLTGVDTVRASIDYVLPSSIENLQLVASARKGDGNNRNNTITGSWGDDHLRGFGGADSLIGGGGDDVLEGGSKDDRLSGDAGADRLIGGSGRDSLRGGKGADIFVFDQTPSAGTADRIWDFEAIDRLELDTRVFTALTAGPLAAAAFHVGAVAQTADHRILYDPTTGHLAYDPDGAGGAGAVAFAQVNIGVLVTAEHFVIV
jgi:Ca2+-binding RTX toxin-like protein